MKLTVTRLDQGRYETLVTRGDGVSYRLKGVAHAFAIPHDLAHFVVEKALRLDRGFWANVADGAVFKSMSYIAGRRKPKAAERSESLLKKQRRAAQRGRGAGSDLQRHDRTGTRRKLAAAAAAVAATPCPSRSGVSPFQRGRNLRGLFRLSRHAVEMGETCRRRQAGSAMVTAAGPAPDNRERARLRVCAAWRSSAFRD
jgi:hypothetical protein